MASRARRLLQLLDALHRRRRPVPAATLAGELGVSLVLRPAIRHEERLVMELRQDFRHFRAERVTHPGATGRRFPVRRHILIRRWRERDKRRAG